jgi:hypothetical protein
MGLLMTILYQRQHFWQERACFKIIPRVCLATWLLITTPKILYFLLEALLIHKDRKYDVLLNSRHSKSYISQRKFHMNLFCPDSSDGKTY